MEDRDKTDKYIILHPKDNDENTRHKYSLVWLHGLGDSAQGFSDVFLDENLNIVPASCKVIIPTAPMRAVTCNGGMVMTSWYDINSLDRSHHTMSRDDHLKNYSQKEIRESIGIVSKLIEGEAEKLGSSTKVFIGGFS